MKFILLDEELEVLLNEKYNDWAGKHIHKGPDGFTLIAFDDEPVAYVSAYKNQLPPPLDSVSEVFIDVLKVDQRYKRRGIATRLISDLEKWAKSKKIYQVRAWSSLDKVEVLPLWQHLGYTLNPAEIWVEPGLTAIRGVYVSKRFYN